ELEGAGRLEAVAVEVPRVDQPEGYVQHGHDEAQLGPGGGAELPDIDAPAFAEGLAGVVEQKGPQGPPHVEVVLGIEQHELVPPEGPVLVVHRAHGPGVDSPDLILTPQEETLVIGE